MAIENTVSSDFDPRSMIVKRPIRCDNENEAGEVTRQKFKRNSVCAFNY